MKNFGDLFNNRYIVVISGNVVMFSHYDKKPAMRKALSYSRRGCYVELWYQHNLGKCNLVSYWN